MSASAPPPGEESGLPRRSCGDDYAVAGAVAGQKLSLRLSSP
jgi:hypothetical protein